MSEIEEDIKFVDEMVKEYNTFGDLDNPDYEDTDRIYKAIENILLERKQDKARIKELEEENSDLKIKNNFRIVGRYAEVKLEEILKKDYIPKQKVKDEIEALRKMLRATMEGKLQEYTPGEIIIKINTLEELLEDK